MDKRVIFATAGAGKTTFIIDKLNKFERALIITYTNTNYNNLLKKILIKFNGELPKNIVLMTYFNFLFRFCYKPFLSEKYKVNGITFEPNLNNYISQSSRQYYINKSKLLYSNRISLLLEKEQLLDEIRSRIKTYFDVFFIDEVQDIAGRDFTFLEHLSSIEMNMLFVGDFYQHTFDTSRDGNVNNNLYTSKLNYEQRFSKLGILVDNENLKNSWRCSMNICEYIKEKIRIDIKSNRTEDDNTILEYVKNSNRIKEILNDKCIIKLHYMNSSKFGNDHKNWGETKGEDNYQDVCVLLNKKTAKQLKLNALDDLPQSTKNKLYVAITRARGNVYFIEEEDSI